MKQLIPDDIIEATGMSEDELKIEIAVQLFKLEKITIEQASRLAGMPRLEFQHLLASRRISIHYDIEDFQNDLETLKRIEQ